MTLMIDIESYDDEPMNADEAIAQCVLANRILYNEKILGVYGHISVRNPENENTFFQSRSLSPGLVTKKDILELDLDGNVVNNTEMKPYGERIIHSSILKIRKDVNAVFHGHLRSVIPFSCTNIAIKPIAHFGAMFYEGIPFYDDYDVSSGMLIATREEGERVARVLGNARAIILRGHGVCVVGKNVQTMVMASIYLNDNAQIQFNAIQLGKPKYLSYEEARKATTIMESKLPLERAWNYWVNRAENMMKDIS